MATLTVWRFPTPTGAEGAVATLEALQKQELIKIHDAGIVTWPDDQKKPKTRQASELAGPMALGGAFWGLLFGLLFAVPAVGVAVGAAGGAVAGSRLEAGIDKDFVASVRSKVQPGTSALFVLASEAVLDQVIAAFEGQQFELIQTDLSSDDEARLREAFGA